MIMEFDLTSLNYSAVFFFAAVSFLAAVFFAAAVYFAAGFFAATLGVSPYLARSLASSVSSFSILA